MGKKFFSQANFADFQSFLTKITKNCLSLIIEIKKMPKTAFFSQFLSHGLKINHYFLSDYYCWDLKQHILYPYCPGRSSSSKE